MGEADITPVEIGRRLARDYLSKRTWSREWRRSLDRQLYAAVQREEFEEKERRVDQLEEDAEADFSSSYDQWRKDGSPGAREVLRGMFEILGKRTDLGFIGKRIVDRLKREFGPA